MIYDSLERLALYRGLHPNLDKAIAYCLERDFSQQEAGKYQLDGDQVFYLIQDNQLAQSSSNELEVHEKYLDLHVLLEGHELIGAGREVAELIKPYDEATDFASVRCQQVYPLEIDQKSFLIFFPNEPHQPNQFAGKEECVRKCVFKVLID